MTDSVSKDIGKVRIKDFLSGRREPLHKIFNKKVVDEIVAMDREIGTLTKLVDELLDYLWVESQEYVMKPSLIDLVDKVHSHIRFFSSAVFSRDIHLEFNPLNQSVWAFADISIVDRIIGTLLVTSIKYAETSVRIDLSSDGKSAWLRVTNDGSYIHPDNSDEVFTPFLKYHSPIGNDTLLGLRIGLPLAKDLARKNSGDLVLEDAGEKGTCFLLTLPACNSPTSIPNDGEDGIAIKPPGRDARFLEQFKKLVMDNLDTDLSNDMIASELGMSQSTLIRKIKRMLGTTPGSYVNNCRLAAAACYLKKNRDASITELCYSVGFTSVSYFAKCFKERYGITPKAYAMDNNLQSVKG